MAPRDQPTDGHVGQNGLEDVDSELDALLSGTSRFVSCLIQTTTAGSNTDGAPSSPTSASDTACDDPTTIGRRDVDLPTKTSHRISADLPHQHTYSALGSIAAFNN